MQKRPVDLDVMQSVRDVFFTPNRYRLDTRFVLNDGKTHPFAVIVPGGGYGMVCSFIEGVPVAKKLNEKGISAFIVYYRVREKAKFPAPQDDLARAVSEIMEHAQAYHVEKSGYSVWGSSAGGHLAASFGTENMGFRKYGLPGPAALVLSYPVISMDRPLTHIGTHDNLLGRDADASSEEFAGIEKHVDADYPPTYLWCGDADQEVDPLNTKVMKEALSASGVPFECDVFPDVGHGVGPATGTSAQGWIEKAVDFWKRQTEEKKRFSTGY